MIITKCIKTVGAEYPIVQGAVGRVGHANLVAAVADRGALDFPKAHAEAIEVTGWRLPEYSSRAKG